MPPKYKSEEDRCNARLQSKRAHYARNKTMEQAKSRNRWQKQSQMSDSIMSSFHNLDILYIELGYKAGDPECNTLQNHFLAVLQCIDTEGWDEYPLSSKMPRHVAVRDCTAMCTGDQTRQSIADQGGTEAYDNAMLAVFAVCSHTWNVYLGKESSKNRYSTQHTVLSLLTRRLWLLVKDSERSGSSSKISLLTMMLQEGQ
ncbi:hypothetical protein EV702DRAFT_1046323 [Suillus placidus]|uniref:Uncharacterized protein n=1 Tax=Suillus placidus TaxID=48579 RepID=A0A9P6ZUP3_9AGAM|nr:hypothetical protein EV702DRAFT_1046323 [Suillus placidus]